jgi:hypothetical protein
MLHAFGHGRKGKNENFRNAEIGVRTGNQLLLI